MKNLNRWWLIALVAGLLVFGGCNSDDDDNAVPRSAGEAEAVVDAGPVYVGVGKADVTGPSAAVVFMGMSDSSQEGEGLLTRSHARAFVFRQGDKKMGYVTADICMVFQGVKQAVVRELDQEGWTNENLMLQGTHTHATPAGSSHYFMYNVAPHGFVQETFDAQVSGIVKAIREAEMCMSEEPLTINEGNLFQCGWNRSPKAYENNPQAELVHYGHVSDLTDLNHEDGFSNVENLDPGLREHTDAGLSTGYVEGRDWNNTDKRMRLLKIGDEAMVNWFALHPTALGAVFRYASGDTKGYAEALWERTHPEMVGAFAQANCGDVSGNIKYGPPSFTANFDWQHCRDLGQREYDKACELYDNDNDGEEKLSCLIDYRHVFVDFSCVESEDPDNYWRTWPAATGGSMSAGSTEDSTSPVPLYNEGVTVDDVGRDGEAELSEKFLALVLPTVFGFIWTDNWDKDFQEGHYPKPILFANGLNKIPATDGETGEPILSPWSPEVLPVQLLRIGELVLCAMPVEVTTMGGRRIENTIKLVFNGDDDKDGFANEDGPVKYVVVCQCSNAYAGYVSTFEEYQEQYYEGASTQFGPHELDAFQQVAGRLATAMHDGVAVDKADEPRPRNLNGSPLREQYPGKIKWPGHDSEAFGRDFGSIVKGPFFADDADGTRYLKLRVWGAFPNRNLMTGKTYFTVKTPYNDSYVMAPEEFTYTDADPETRLQWEKNALGQSKITLWFDMTDQPESGEYEFTYTAEALTGNARRLPIRKRYTFNVEDVENGDVDVRVEDF